MPEITPSKYLVTAGWDDVPHLDETAKRELLSGTQEYLRESRSKGIPSLGSGAIYPIQWGDVTVSPFAIPAFWRKAYAMDVGWNVTAAMWMAEDPSDGMRYAYAEYYGQKSLPTIHATAIKLRGEWVRGAIDPASRGRSQHDGTQLLAEYNDLDLKLSMANNAVTAGIDRVWTDLTTGRLKLFTTLQKTKAEYLIYRRNEHGVIVKKNDHLLDCLRYLEMTFDKIASIQKPDRATNSSIVIADQKAGY